MSVEIGDEAPDFELPDQHGKPVKLSSFRGAKNVVLVFYPLAFSPVCSGELCAMREDFPEVTGGDVELLTVSVDSFFSHKVWAEQENFQFSLLADFWPHGGVAKTYGVFDETRGLAIRGTFIIDKEGIVRWKVVNPVPQARDIADYQKALAELALCAMVVVSPPRNSAPARRPGTPGTIAFPWAGGCGAHRASQRARRGPRGFISPGDIRAVLPVRHPAGGPGAWQAEPVPPGRGR
jgi:mycoredoxin-dependent peroxiredoxin